MKNGRNNHFNNLHFRDSLEAKKCLTTCAADELCIMKNGRSERAPGGDPAAGVPTPSGNTNDSSNNNTSNNTDNNTTIAADITIAAVVVVVVVLLLLLLLLLIPTSD